MITGTMISSCNELALLPRCMIRKSMPSGHDPMGGYRFSEKIMLKKKDRAG
jgi:hypothetical protein